MAGWGWGMAGWVDGMVDIVIPGLATDSITASHSVTTEMIDFVSGTGFSGTSSCSPEHRTATTTVLSACGPAGVGACDRSATEAGDQSDTISPTAGVDASSWNGSSMKQKTGGQGGWKADSRRARPGRIRSNEIPNVRLVCTANSTPDVMMVKPAEDRVRTNDSDLLDRTKNRRILVQRPMRSDGVVVSGIGN
jgi:hypothetical protein